MHSSPDMMWSPEGVPHQSIGHISESTCFEIVIGLLSLLMDRKTKISLAGIIPELVNNDQDKY